MPQASGGKSEVVQALVARDLAHDDPRMLSAKKGEQVDVYGSSKKFLKAIGTDGKKGFISKDDLEDGEALLARMKALAPDTSRSNPRGKSPAPLGSMSSERSARAGGQTAVVILDSLHDDARMLSVHKGDSIVVYGYHKSWLKATGLDGKKGFVAKDVVEDGVGILAKLKGESPAAPAKTTPTSSSADQSSAPHPELKDDQIIAVKDFTHADTRMLSVELGEVLDVLGFAKGWIKCSNSSAVMGFVAPHCLKDGPKVLQDLVEKAAAAAAAAAAGTTSTNRSRRKDKGGDKAATGDMASWLRDSKAGSEAASANRRADKAASDKRLAEDTKRAAEQRDSDAHAAKTERMVAYIKESKDRRSSLLIDGVDCMRHILVIDKATRKKVRQRDAVRLKLSPEQDGLLIIKAGADADAKGAKVPFASCKDVAFGPVTPLLRTRDAYLDPSYSCCVIVFKAFKLDLCFDTALNCASVFLAVQDRMPTQPVIQISMGLLWWEVARLKLADKAMRECISVGKMMIRVTTSATESMDAEVASGHSARCFSRAVDMWLTQVKTQLKQWVRWSRLLRSNSELLGRTVESCVVLNQTDWVRHWAQWSHLLEVHSGRIGALMQRMVRFWYGRVWQCLYAEAALRSSSSRVMARLIEDVFPRVCRPAIQIWSAWSEGLIAAATLLGNTVESLAQTTLRACVLQWAEWSQRMFDSAKLLKVRLDSTCENLLRPIVSHWLLWAENMKHYCSVLRTSFEGYACQVSRNAFAEWKAALLSWASTLEAAQNARKPDPEFHKQVTAAHEAIVTELDDAMQNDWDHLIGLEDVSMSWNGCANNSTATFEVHVLPSQRNTGLRFEVTPRSEDDIFSNEALFLFVSSSLPAPTEQHHELASRDWGLHTTADGRIANALEIRDIPLKPVYFVGVQCRSQSHFTLNAFFGPAWEGATPTIARGKWLNDGSAFKGEVRQGIPYNGSGKWVLNNVAFHGDWVCGSGCGRIEYVNGHVYTGAWQQQGMKHGSGSMLYVSGTETARGDGGDRSSFVGDWVNDLMHGQGVMKYAKSADATVLEYSGAWIHGLKSGSGCQMYCNGDLFSGDFQNGKHWGFGMMEYANGSCYDGTWVDGKRTGQGRMEFEDTELYEGDWLNNERHGWGNHIYLNRNCYEGRWENDLKYGEGTMTYGFGDVFQGKWDDDKWQGPSGVLKYANGDVYQGAFNSEKVRAGQGLMQYANGDMFEGDWDGNEGDSSRGALANRTLLPTETVGSYPIILEDIIVAALWASEHTVVQPKTINSTEAAPSDDASHAAWIPGLPLPSEPLPYAPQPWHFGWRTDVGVMEYADGSEYEGGFESDKRSGAGKITYRNGDEYDGTFEADNRADGEGTIVFKDTGDSYTGDLKQFVQSDAVDAAAEEATAGVTVQPQRLYHINGSGKATFGDAEGILESYEGLWHLSVAVPDEGKLTYTNGDDYVGRLFKARFPFSFEEDDGLQGWIRHGAGKMVYSDGDDYEGQWVMSIRHGSGKASMVVKEAVKTEDKNVYEGQWDNDLMNGEGEMAYHSGDKFSGQFSANQRSGKGSCVYASGDEYDGQWLDDMRDTSAGGIGTLVLVDDMEYEGQWKCDLMHGKGVFSYADDSEFDGLFVNNERQDGHGLMTYSEDGWLSADTVLGALTEYEGEWKAEKFEGKGSVVLLNGDEFEGQWQAGVRTDGAGTMTYAENGSVYTGQWLAGKWHGEGVLEDAESGDKYSGQWTENAKTGKGIMNYANGDIYDGEWKQGRKTGEGKMSFENGDMYKGQFVDEKKIGVGTMHYGNGDVYEGQWDANKKNGEGVLTRSNGQQEVGVWEKNSRKRK